MHFVLCCFHFSGVKLNIICPCTEKHIQKYSTQDIRIVLETPDLYRTVTEPRLRLESEQFTLDVRENVFFFFEN